ncbi:MAG: hypothetical protein VX738_16065 [Planctomycetota bacterium]|nr:hypothetical protein [Planctomycetota bacterium]
MNFNISLRKLLIVGFVFLTANIQAEDKLDIDGKWSGTWRSEISDHQGPLKAKFEVIDESKIRAKFTGRFFKIIPFRFDVVLTVVESADGVTTLKGSQDLGRTLGKYEYTAKYSKGKFVAEYSTEKDKGLFEVSR